MADLSKYLENDSFIEWVFHPNETVNSKWEQYLDENPKEKQEILQLKTVLSILTTPDDVATQEEKTEILIRLNKQINNHQKQVERKKFRKNLMRFAAGVLIVLAVGSYLFYSGQEKVDYSAFITSSGNMSDQQSIELILSEEKSVEIKNDNSVINYDPSGEIIVNEGDEAYKVDKADASKMNTIKVPFGKRTKILLADGTQVHLNSGSQLIYPSQFNKNKREIYLDGEAFFEVTKNKDVPFIVKTPEDYYVRVVGTKFNISAYKSDRRVETVLAEGLVDVVQHNGNFFKNKIRLTPGEMASWHSGMDEMSVQKVNVENYILWTEGLLLFEDLELNRIAKKLERYFNIRIHFEDPMNGTIYIGGKLDLNQDLSEVLNNLASTVSLNVKKIDENQYLLSE